MTAAQFISRVAAHVDAAEQRALRPSPWFEFVVPGEQPHGFLHKRRWRRRHERIRSLEYKVGIYPDFYRLPWESYF